MPKTQVNCPNCKQPVVVEVQQLFDVAKDPLAKQKLLTNAVNFLRCPTCGYQGLLGVPVVFHDPEKELLLTFLPPDLNKTVNEQEKQIGPLISKIMDELPKEKRKAYLFQPKSMLTYQSLIEKILEADGITKEMIEDQQKKVGLVEKLIQANKEERLKLIADEKSIIDINFFTLFSRIIQSASAQGDQATQDKLIEIQNELFENTEVGKEIFENAQATEAAIKKLQDASKDGLTREKLLELLLNTNDDLQLSTIASLARSGIDYVFFQQLSEKIDSAKDDKEKKHLLEIRKRLLEITDEIDKRLQEELKKASENLSKVLAAEKIEEFIMGNSEIINEFFLQQLEAALKNAKKAGDLEKISKLEKIMVVIEKTTAPTKEIQLLEKLLKIEDVKQLDEEINMNIDQLTPEFFSVANNVLSQTKNQSEQPELSERLKALHKALLRASMKKNKNQEKK